MDEKIQKPGLRILALALGMFSGSALDASIRALKVDGPLQALISRLVATMPLIGFRKQDRSLRDLLERQKSELFAQLSREGQFNTLSDASEKDCARFWGSLGEEEEFLSYWDRLDQGEKDRYFQYISEHFRGECYPELSVMGKSDNFGYLSIKVRPFFWDSLDKNGKDMNFKNLPEEARTLERYGELGDPGMNFPHLSEENRPKVYAQLDPIDKACYFHLLSSVWRLRFWPMLGQEGKDVCFRDLPPEGQATRYSELSEEGKLKYPNIRPEDLHNWDIAPMFWTPIKFNIPEETSNPPHE